VIRSYVKDLVRISFWRGDGFFALQVLILQQAVSREGALNFDWKGDRFAPALGRSARKQLRQLGV
jgi:hypothetical protein